MIICKLILPRTIINYHDYHARGQRVKTIVNYHEEFGHV